MMKDLFRWALLVKLAPFLQRMPLALLHVAASGLGLFQYVVYRRARRIIRASFTSDLDMPPLRREFAVICSFYHHLLNDLELLKYEGIDLDFIERHVKLTGPGWDYLRENKKNAAILVTFHFGPNQIIIPILPCLGYSFTQMAVPPSYWDNLVEGGPKLKAVNRKRTENLESTGARFIYVSGGIASLREALRAIQRGEMLCLAGDGRLGESRPFPFLRGNLNVALGAHYLAAKQSLPLIPVISIRKNAGFVIDMQGPLYPDEENQEMVMLACISHLENYAARHPEQYGWMYYAKAMGG